MKPLKVLCRFYLLFLTIIFFHLQSITAFLNKIITTCLYIAAVTFKILPFMLAICKLLLINHLPIMERDCNSSSSSYVSHKPLSMMMMLHYAPFNNRDAAWQVNFAITSRFFSSLSSSAITDYFVMCACENDRLNGQASKKEWKKRE